MRLYIADDNLDFAAYCAEVAEQVGWTVTLCADGRELVDAFKLEDTPALLLVDIQMPGMDGIQVIEELKTATRPFRMRFITGGPASSALAARMIADARDLDTGRYLTKPISMSDLRKVFVEEAELIRGYGSTCRGQPC